MPPASMQEWERIALASAKRGWHVFPVHSIGHDGSCTSSKKLGCSNPGKHPRWNAKDLPHGLLNAATDPTLIQRWWRRWPSANIAARAGVGFGLVVVDADLAKGGVDSWRELQDVHGPVVTLTTLTGGGGNHIIFQDPGVGLKSDDNVLGPGLDTRAEGGYFILPPSRHISGHRYEWDTKIPSAQVPEWLLDLWPRAQDRQKGGGVHHQAGWLAEILAKGIPDGERDTRLTSIYGYLLRRHPASEAEALLLSINESRCQPPLMEEQVIKIMASIDKAEAQNHAFRPATPAVLGGRG